VAWHFDSKGIWSVKSAYHVLEDNQELKKVRVLMLTVVVLIRRCGGKFGN
jgi:hypothetical protein